MPFSKAPGFALVVLFGGMFWASAAANVRITLPAETTSSNEEGVVTLAWESDTGGQDARFELQQSNHAKFPEDSVKSRYTGPDRGSVLTGFAEGTHHFRVRLKPEEGEPGPWSDPVAVEVTYMATSKVILLLSIGIVVFAATIGTLLAGHFRKPAV